MAYKVTLKKRAIKALEKINEPYYSNIKEAIYRLAEKPRPAGYKM
jgi:mRNA interferase RelE/StbE